MRDCCWFKLPCSNSCYLKEEVGGCRVGMTSILLGNDGHLAFFFWSLVFSWNFFISRVAEIVISRRYVVHFCVEFFCVVVSNPYRPLAC